METKIVQTLRPVKLCFLILPNDKQSFIKALNICSSYWGGKYFPILPFYQKFSKGFTEEFQTFSIKANEFYQNTFENFQIDYLVYSEKIILGNLQKLFPNKKLVSITVLEEALLNKETKFGLGLHDVIDFLIEKEFKYVRNDNLRILLPVTTVNNLFLQTLSGSISEKYLAIIKENSKLKDENFLQVKNENFELLFETNNLNYLDLGSKGLMLNESLNWRGQDSIILIDKNSLKDVMLFWNLRAMGWNITAVQSNLYDTPIVKNQISLLASKYKDKNITYGITVIKNDSIDDRTQKKFELLLNSYNTEGNQVFIYQWWIPRFWEERTTRRHDRAFAVQITSEQRSQTAQTDPFVSIPILKPRFTSNLYYNHLEPLFVNEFRLSYNDRFCVYASVLPRMDKNETHNIIRGMGEWRLTNSNLCFIPHNHDHNAHFNLPTSKNVFEQLYNRKGLKIITSTAGKLTEEVFKNIGGIRGTNFLAKKAMPIIIKLFEDGKVVYKEGIFGAISKYKDLLKVKTPKTIVQGMIDNKMIALGVQIQCSTCERTSFYLVDNIGHKLKCPICQNTFNLPSHNPDEIKWSYKGIGAFSLNNNANGIVPVLLTLRFFRISLGAMEITSSFSYNVYKEKECINEVDLSVFYQKYSFSSPYPDLLLCECKTYYEFEKKDVERMKLIGKQFPGAILTFSTLKKNLSSKEKELLKGLANFFRTGNNYRPVNPILILTENELIPENYDVYHNLKPLIIDRIRFEDELGHLCDVTCQRYLDLNSYREIVEDKFKKRMDEIMKSKH